MLQILHALLLFVCPSDYVFSKFSPNFNLENQIFDTYKEVFLCKNKLTQICQILRGFFSPTLLDFYNRFQQVPKKIKRFFFSLSYLAYNQILLNFLLVIQHFGYNTKLRKPKMKKDSSTPLISTLLRVFSLNVWRKLKCQIRAMDLNFHYLDCVIQTP